LVVAEHRVGEASVGAARSVSMRDSCSCKDDVNPHERILTQT
jgi:hypothetical protein